MLQQAQFIPVSCRLVAEATQPVARQNFCLLPFTFCLLFLLFAHMHMWLTGSLQSLKPVLPPMARTDRVYMVPGVSPSTTMWRACVEIPPDCHAPGVVPKAGL